jgi:hypothetical protein
VRIKGEIDGKPFDVVAVSPAQDRGMMSALAALQRETGMKLAEVQAMGRLEMPALQLSIFLSLWAAGLRVSFSRAEDMLDEVEFVIEPGDTGPEPDPTNAPAVDGEGVTL